MFRPLCASVLVCFVFFSTGVAYARPHQEVIDAVPEATRIILDASRSENARFRANAIEAMKPRPERALALAQAALKDPNPAVRFTALVIIGQQQARELGPLARQTAGQETAQSTRAAALYAAYRCGEDVSLTPLAQMLLSRDATVRANVAMLLGELGNNSALPLLNDRFNAPMPRASAVEVTLVRLQIAESMLKLGEDQALDYLRSKTRDVDDETRIAAVRALARAGDTAMIENFNNLMDPEEQPIQVRLAAAEAMAILGSSRGLHVMLLAANYDGKAVREQIENYLQQARGDLRTLEAAADNQGGDAAGRVEQRTVAQLRARIRSYEQLRRDDPQHQAIAALIRAQAALALGEAQTDKAQQRLVMLLKDQDPAVRLAAAAGVLKVSAKDPGNAR